MKVVWSGESLAEKEAIWHFLADRSPAYADRTEARLEARTASLAYAPSQGRPMEDSGLRRLSIPDVQLVVVYGVDEEMVRILGVRSTAQDEKR